MTNLCYRCEWRAAYLETGSGPRAECQSKYAVSGCYMYRPVIPCKVSLIKGEKRPPFGGAFISGRVYRVGLADGEYEVVKKGKEYSVYFVPKRRKK